MPPGTPEKKIVLKSSWAFYLLAGLGLFSRVYGLSREGLWLDEIYSWVFSNPSKPLAFLFARHMAGDVHPPLYNIFLHFWGKLFGVTEAALRIPSALFGVLAIIIIFLARPLFERETWFILLALMSCSFGAVYYSQEARSYSLMLFFSLSACLLMIKISRSTGNFEGLPHRWLVLLSFVLLIASYSHYFGIILAGGIFFALIIENGKASFSKGAVLAAYGLAVLVLFLPWVFYQFRFISGYLGGNFWIKNDLSLINKFLRLAVGNHVTLAFFTLLFIWALSKNHHIFKEPVIRLALASGLFTLLTALIISVHTPLFTARNTIILLPHIYILISLVFSGLIAGPSSLESRRIALCLFLAGCLIMLSGYYIEGLKPRREQWRESAAFIQSQAGCGDGTIIIGGPWRKEPFWYYIEEGSRLKMKYLHPLLKNIPFVDDVLADDCPVIMWFIMSGENKLDKYMDVLEIKKDEVVIKNFYGAYVVLEK